MRSRPQTTGRENGNGSLMRVLPLALWHAGSDQTLVADAHLQSLPTHAHLCSMVACAFYCLVARGYLLKLDDPWTWADQKLEDVYRTWSNTDDREAFLAELDVLRSFPERHNPCGSGYVIDTIWSARKALEAPSFEDAVRTAISFGNDTDIAGAVAGGLAGIRSGINGIPKQWLEQLRGVTLIEPLMFEFGLRMIVKAMDEADDQRT